MSNVGQGFPPITQDTGEPGGPYFEGAGNGTSAPGTSSTTDTAKEQAGQVAQDAKESGKQVAGTAADEGKQVLAEGRRQVKDLTAQAGQQVDEQTRVQKDKATAGLRDLADELHAIASRERWPVRHRHRPRAAGGDPGPRRRRLAGEPQPRRDRRRAPGDGPP